MFTIRTKTYHKQNNWDFIAAKLDLDVELVGELVEPIFSNAATTSDRPWAGRIENDSKAFEVVRKLSAEEISPRFSRGTYLEFTLLTIFVHGSFVEESAENKLVIK